MGPLDVASTKVVIFGLEHQNMYLNILSAIRPKTAVEVIKKAKGMGFSGRITTRASVVMESTAKDAVMLL